MLKFGKLLLLLVAQVVLECTEAFLYKNSALPCYSLLRVLVAYILQSCVNKFLLKTLRDGSIMSFPDLFPIIVFFSEKKRLTTKRTEGARQ